MSDRRWELSRLALASPPILPAFRFVDGVDGKCSTISPVAILATFVAQLTASAGRRSPFGPVGVAQIPSFVWLYTVYLQNDIQQNEALNREDFKLMLRVVGRRTPETQAVVASPLVLAQPTPPWP